jgi:Holliday junction resolvase
MIEKSVENKIKKYLFSKGIYHFKVHGSKFMVKGIPDLVCCYKGKFLGIEVKKPGNKSGQTEEQKIHERNITKSGGIYLLVDDVNEVIDYVEAEENND